MGWVEENVSAVFREEFWLIFATDPPAIVSETRFTDWYRFFNSTYHLHRRPLQVVLFVS